MKKQDRCGVRTASDLEQKYDFGALGNNATSTAKLEEQTKQLNQTLSQFIANTNARFEEIEEIETTGTHFYSGVPTLLNEPAISWETDELKQEHIGDMYYDTDNGHIYLFKITDDVYEWVECLNESSSEGDVSNLQTQIDELNDAIDSKANQSDLESLQDDVDSTLSTAKSYTDTKVANLIGSAPETLNTLEEIAQAIEENEDVVDALNSAIGTKASQSDLNSLQTTVNTKANQSDLTTLQNTVSANETTLSNHTSNKSNPHGVTASQVGLGNVDNTSDANKPISTATQNAINGVKTLVCNVEEIFNKNVVSFTANSTKSIYSFTATKKCEVNLMIYICGENTGVCPKLIQVYAGSNVVGYTALSSANGHVMTLPVNTILNAGQGIVVYSQFFHTGNNTITISGFVRNLE